MSTFSLNFSINNCCLKDLLDEDEDQKRLEKAMKEHKRNRSLAKPDPLSDLCSEKYKWNKKPGLKQLKRILNTFQMLKPNKSMLPMLYATTITIDRRYWGLNNKEQYIKVRNILQAYVRIRKDPCFYVAEITQNMVIHFHGIEYGNTQGLFCETFKQFGNHNTDDRSYAPVGDVSKYIEYMLKDQEKPIYCGLNDEDFNKLSTFSKYVGIKKHYNQYPPIYYMNSMWRYATIEDEVQDIDGA